VIEFGKPVNAFRFVGYLTFLPRSWSGQLFKLAETVELYRPPQPTAEEAAARGWADTEKTTSAARRRAEESAV
jgi:hypothetical protein